MRAAGAWMLALLLLADGAASAMQGEAADAFTRAQQAFAARHYREAAELFRQAAAKPAGGPELHPDALLMEAKSLINLKEPAAAEPLLRSFVAANPRSSEALYLLGYVLHRENRPKESLVAYTEAAAIRAPSADDLKIVALDYVLLNDYADAVHWLERSVAANPADPEAWYDLGRAQMNQGNFPEAERDFNKTLTLAPDDAKALDNLGLSLEAQNRTEEALAAYQRAVAAQAGRERASEQPLLNLGTLLNAKNRSAEAVKPLAEATRLTPGCARCHEELGRAYLGLGKDAPATSEMEKAVALDPKNPRLHYQLGQIYRRAGLTAKAEAELKISAGLYGAHSTPEDR